MIIGAGETAELTARALASKGVTTIFVANRHAARARSLADRFGGSVLALDMLPDQLVRADMVVASTASPHAILEEEELGLVMRAAPGPAAAACSTSPCRATSSRVPGSSRASRSSTSTGCSASSRGT